LDLRSHFRRSNGGRIRRSRCVLGIRTRLSVRSSPWTKTSGKGRSAHGGASGGAASDPLRFSPTLLVLWVLGAPAVHDGLGLVVCWRLRRLSGRLVHLDHG